MSEIAYHWAKNLTTSALTHLKDKVSEPAIGSIVYCDLVFGISEEIQHSGVYVGKGHIVGLNRDGYIRSENYSHFTSGGLGWSIYVSCDKYGNPVGSKETALRAENKIDTFTNYHALNNNCHKFSSGCLTGDFNNEYNMLSHVKHLAEIEMNAIEWRVWDI